MTDGRPTVDRWYLSLKAPRARPQSSLEMDASFDSSLCVSVCRINPIHGCALYPDASHRRRRPDEEHGTERKETPPSSSTHALLDDERTNGTKRVNKNQLFVQID